MFEENFIKRIVNLRMRKNVSARDMSLSMGQSAGYMNKIETGQSLPSMMGFFYICDYFRITPKEFFDDDFEYPEVPLIIQEILEDLHHLNDKQRKNIAAIVNDLKKEK